MDPFFDCDNDFLLKIFGNNFTDVFYDFPFYSKSHCTKSSYSDCSTNSFIIVGYEKILLSCFGQKILTDHFSQTTIVKLFTDQSQLSALTIGCKFRNDVFQGIDGTRLSNEDIEKLVNGTKFDEVGKNVLNSLC